jgi:hypothetical protein
MIIIEGFLNANIPLGKPCFRTVMVMLDWSSSNVAPPVTSYNRRRKISSGSASIEVKIYSIDIRSSYIGCLWDIP